MSKLARYFLFPFRIIYGTGAFFRNKLYDYNIRKGVSFDLPVIAIGNLTTGGTGKTPHAEYLIRLLQSKYKVGVLSRGYKRTTTGYVLVEENNPWQTAGDEPLQVKKKFPKAAVAVCEDRVRGIPNLLADHPDLGIILLDDAFQHRAIKAGLSILLTDFAKPFTEDSLLPAGRLRESKQGASRADVIVVTKSPPHISDKERERIAAKLRQNPNQQVLFSHLKYEPAYSLFNPDKKILHDNKTAVLLVCGIANPAPLINELKQLAPILEVMKFKDHHAYSLNDVKNVCAVFHSLQSETKILLTTEKDGVRLLPFKNYFQEKGVEVYCIPVVMHFGNDTDAFHRFIFDFLEREFYRRGAMSAEQYDLS